MSNKKIKLGDTPTSFEKNVPIPVIDGGFEDIKVTFIYRTKPQFAELIDENQREASELDKENADGAEKLTFVELFSKTSNFQVKNILKIASGWDLTDKFSKESLLQLEAEHPGSLDSIASVYRHAVGEARTKN